MIGQEGVLDWEALEVAIRRQALQLAAHAVEARFNNDTSDGVVSHRKCGCGRVARYAGRREKAFTTVLGVLRLQRAYYHCEACGQGHFPRDAALGLRDGTLSPGLVRMIGVVGAMVSFQEGSDLLQELAGVLVDAKQVERTAEELGREIAQDERQVVELPTVPDIAPTLYLGMDGTGVPMRGSELEGRAGKQPDGSSKTREVKLCTVWSAESRDAEGKPVRDEGSVSYSAAIESAAMRDTENQPSDFAQRVRREARRRGFEQAARQVVIGDGAPWIWNLTSEYYPRAIQIVDLYHAKSHLCEVAQAIYSAGTTLSAQWAKRRHAELESDKFDALLKALDKHQATCKQAEDCLDYFAKNRQRMRYAHFRSKGLCVTSAVVEAGCKVTVGSRLKRAGMHWTVRGANAILALRCYRLSGRFEDFWERRPKTRACGSRT